MNVNQNFKKDIFDKKIEDTSVRKSLDNISNKNIFGLLFNAAAVGVAGGVVNLINSVATPIAKRLFNQPTHEESIALKFLKENGIIDKNKTLKGNKENLSKLISKSFDTEIVQIKKDVHDLVFKEGSFDSNDINRKIDNCLDNKAMKTLESCLKKINPEFDLKKIFKDESAKLIIAGSTNDNVTNNLAIVENLVGNNNLNKIIILSLAENKDIDENAKETLIKEIKKEKNISTFISNLLIETKDPNKALGLFKLAKNLSLENIKDGIRNVADNEKIKHNNKPSEFSSKIDSNDGYKLGFEKNSDKNIKKIIHNLDSDENAIKSPEEMIELLGFIKEMSDDKKIAGKEAIKVAKKSENTDDKIKLLSFAANTCEMKDDAGEKAIAFAGKQNNAEGVLKLLSFAAEKCEIKKEAGKKAIDFSGVQDNTEDTLKLLSFAADTCKMKKEAGEKAIKTDRDSKNTEDKIKLLTFAAEKCEKKDDAGEDAIAFAQKSNNTEDKIKLLTFAAEKCEKKEEAGKDAIKSARDSKNTEDKIKLLTFAAEKCEMKKEAGKKAIKSVRDSKNTEDKIKLLTFAAEKCAMKDDAGEEALELFSNNKDLNFLKSAADKKIVDNASAREIALGVIEDNYTTELKLEFLNFAAETTNKKDTKNDIIAFNAGKKAAEFSIKTENIDDKIKLLSFAVKNGVKKTSSEKAIKFAEDSKNTEDRIKLLSFVVEECKKKEEAGKKAIKFAVVSNNTEDKIKLLTFAAEKCAMKDDAGKKAIAFAGGPISINDKTKLLSFAYKMLGDEAYKTALESAAAADPKDKAFAVLVGSQINYKAADFINHMKNIQTGEKKFKNEDLLEIIANVAKKRKEKNNIDDNLVKFAIENAANQYKNNKSEFMKYLSDIPVTKDIKLNMLDALAQNNDINKFLLENVIDDLIEKDSSVIDIFKKINPFIKKNNELSKHLETYLTNLYIKDNKDKEHRIISVINEAYNKNDIFQKIKKDKDFKQMNDFKRKLIMIKTNPFSNDF